MTHRTSGFTVIELIFIVVLLGAASVLFFMQKNSVEMASRDTERKTAINAMYYSLEEVFYPKNGYYPRAIDSSTLPSVDPTLFKDPTGKQIDTAGSNYRYKATNCAGDQCRSYSLRADLENEQDFVKDSRNS